jgi:small subunit ribosomal protein S4
VFAARQFVNHGLITVNGRRVTIPSYLVKEGDVIEPTDRAKQFAVILEANQQTERDVPDYIGVDGDKLRVTLVRTPKLADVPYPVQMEPNLVVEYYSR